MCGRDACRCIVEVSALVVLLPDPPLAGEAAFTERWALLPGGAEAGRSLPGSHRAPAVPDSLSTVVEVPLADAPRDGVGLCASLLGQDGDDLPRAGLGAIESLGDEDDPAADLLKLIEDQANLCDAAPSSQPTTVANHARDRSNASVWVWAAYACDRAVVQFHHHRFEPAPIAVAIHSLAVPIRHGSTRAAIALDGAQQPPSAQPQSNSTATPTRLCLHAVRIEFPAATGCGIVVAGPDDQEAAWRAATWSTTAGVCGTRRRRGTGGAAAARGRGRQPHVGRAPGAVRAGVPHGPHRSARRGRLPLPRQAVRAQRPVRAAAGRAGDRPDGAGGGVGRRRAGDRLRKIGRASCRERV